MTVAAERLDLAGRFVEHIDAEAAVLALAKPSLPRGDEVDGHVVLEHGDLRVRGVAGEQRALDLAAR